MPYRIIQHDLVEADLLDITLFISSYAGPAIGKAKVCFTVDDESMTVLIVCISYAGSDWQARVKNRV